MIEQADLSNRILLRLDAEDFALLAGKLEPIKYKLGVVIGSPNVPLKYVYFFGSGVASVVAQSPGGMQAEAGMIGREGFVHPAIVLGAEGIPSEIIVQIADDAHRIEAAILRDAANKSASLRRVLLLFAHYYSLQTTFTALSNAVHRVDERLARWLLMIHDRSESNDLPITHEVLGVMLAVQRPSVTNALHVLEGHRFIECSRGNIRVSNRTAMEAFARDSYGVPEAEYGRLLGQL